MNRTIPMRASMFTAAVFAAIGSCAGAVNWTCPANYEVKAGLNADFPHKGMKRAFLVYPPADLSKPAPVWVPLTGSVESTHDNLTVARSGANSLMADKGFMVIGPVRACANQDPNLKGGPCNGPGKDGWNWNPWFEGRAAARRAIAGKTTRDRTPVFSRPWSSVSAQNTSWTASESISAAFLQAPP